MQTIYYETSSFIRHEGNVVDLGVYRQKLSAAAGENWSTDGAELIQTPLDEEPTYSTATLRLLPQAPAEELKPRKHRQPMRKLALALDLCATLAVVALTITGIVIFLGLA